MFVNILKAHVQQFTAKMVFRFSMAQKLRITISRNFMGTMSYSHIMLMIDLISKWIHLEFGGMHLTVGL